MPESICEFCNRAVPAGAGECPRCGAPAPAEPAASPPPPQAPAAEETAEAEDQPGPAAPPPDEAPAPQPLPPPPPGITEDANRRAAEGAAAAAHAAPALPPAPLPEPPKKPPVDPKWLLAILALPGLCIAVLIVAGVYFVSNFLAGNYEPTVTPMATTTAVRIVTATPSAQPSPGTPTVTRSATPVSPTAQRTTPVPTGPAHATYTPLPVVTRPPNLPAGTSTLSLEGNIYTGVRVYMKTTAEYLFEVLGRADDCPAGEFTYPAGKGIKTRLPNAKEQWGSEKSMLAYASSGMWVVRADDPALKTKRLDVLPGCGQ